MVLMVASLSKFRKVVCLKMRSQATAWNYTSQVYLHQFHTRVGSHRIMFLFFFFLFSFWDLCVYREYCAMRCQICLTMGD